MSKRKFKVYYYYPVTISETRKKIVNLSPILKEIEKIEPESRIIKDGEGNIQLKKIEYDSESCRWYLSFLRNKIDAPFKTKLYDNTDKAESLDDDEFVGHECCAIYDEESKVISIQNNRSSTSFNGIKSFFNMYIDEPFMLSAITYKDKYCNISDDDLIKYKSVIVSYTDASKLIELASLEEDELLKSIGKLANNMSATTGKLEFGVGRSKNLLGKPQLRKLVDFFKKHNEITANLKVKMVDEDTIRLIDLINNKVDDDVEITITKDDPKTFKKILNAMDSVLDTAKKETFDKCSKYINL
ncbi:DUF6731 family protein [Clostridium sp.]|uniref:DUF6731 family protein n=1 Tax=Clostridium sp. TaxID=1506 RepID=UPI001B695B54|nr:DUF6731 family protein [Clostridium sp.]MBP3916101.1 hypothetical protein [Clostridium sp.]